MKNNIFIVGTGRCGSTLLSNMFNLNEQILSISEFFTGITDLGTLMDECFPKEQISAKHFWSLLSSPPKKQNLMLKEGIAAKEILYKISDNAHFTNETGIPAIMLTTLPHISDNPDELFYELEQYILSLPNAYISVFYNAFFEWLKKRLNKQIWIERSGGSLRGIHRLYKTFPDAKFIHIVRAGQNCSISMEKHYAFRLVMVVFQLMEILGVDPFEDSNREWVDDLYDDIAYFLPENFDAEKFKNFRLSPSLFGYYWSGEIAEGMKTFAKIPNKQKLTIQYEHILSDPIASVQKIAKFVGNEYCSEKWINQASALIHAPKSNHKELSDAEQRFLNNSCKLGFDVLKKFDIHYSYC